MRSTSSHSSERATPAGKQRHGRATAPAVRGARRAAELRRPVTSGDVAAASAPRQGWREAIATTVTGFGFELVDVERGQRGLLRVTIDRIPGRSYALSGDAVLVEDCEQVTRQLQYVLEVEGLDYARLEVSSPGLDRPLRTEADYARFAGQPMKLTLKLPFEGRKVWQGVLMRVEGAEPGGWQLLVNENKTERVLGFTLAEVREARLVPVLNFKGRRPQATGGSDGQDNPPAAHQAAAAPGQDGTEAL